MTWGHWVRIGTRRYWKICLRLLLLSVFSRSKIGERFPCRKRESEAFKNQPETVVVKTNAKCSLRWKALRLSDSFHVGHSGVDLLWFQDNVQKGHFWSDWDFACKMQKSCWVSSQIDYLKMLQERSDIFGAPRVRWWCLSYYTNSASSKKIANLMMTLYRIACWPGQPRVIAILCSLSFFPTSIQDETYLRYWRAID